MLNTVYFDQFYNIMQDIFELCQRENNEKLRNGNDNSSSEKSTRHVLICGAPHSGKSSLLARYAAAGSAEARRGGAQFACSAPMQAERTIALDCSYARRVNQSGSEDGELVYFWELGGGGSLSELIDVFLKPSTIQNFAVILFVDLCRVEEFNAVTVPLLDSLRRRFDKLQNDLRTSHLTDAQTRAREHTDSSIINPLPVPTTILAGKYDLFQNLDTDRKRTVWRLLRYLAHVNGANLMTHSNNISTLTSRTWSLLSYYAFGGPPPAMIKQNTVDVHGAVFVGAFYDSIKAIELPTRARVLSYEDAMHQWSRTLADHFPQIEPGQESGGLSSARRTRREENGGELADERQFAEPLIDALVSEKMKELDLFVKRRIVAKTKPASFFN